MPPFVRRKFSKVMRTDIYEFLFLRTTKYGLVTVLVDEIGKKGKDVELHKPIMPIHGYHANLQIC